MLFRSANHTIEEITRNQLDNALLNISDRNRLISRISELDVLLHLGWLGTDAISRQDVEIQKKNLEYSKALIQCVADTNSEKLHFIGVGSQAEFGDRIAPWADDSTVKPQCEYSNAKIQVLAFLRKKIQNYTWARVFSCYGPNDRRKNVFRTTAKSMVENKPINLSSCLQKWSNLHVDDVTRGFVVIIDKQIKGEMNIADSEPMTLREQLLEFAYRNTSLLMFEQLQLLPLRHVFAQPGLLIKNGWKPSINIRDGMRNYFGEILQMLSHEISK